MKVLAFVNYYLPGYRAGGPTRSILGLVDQLGKEIEFSIVTGDRDYGDMLPYSGITPGKWTDVGNARVCYVSQVRWSSLSALLSGNTWDILYLQSFFNPNYTLRPLVWHHRGLLTAYRVLVAPRGEFSTGALDVRKWKKRLYTSLSSVCKCYRDVYWHTSSEFERLDLLRAIPRIADAGRVFVAPNLPPLSNSSGGRLESSNERGDRLRVLFLSRITEMKNLKFAINVLAGVQSDVEFNVYGPIDRGAQYWNECSRDLADLPSNIDAKYHGDVPHEAVSQLLASHDVLLLPTKGENFGHVILESLHAGCPVLISDRTPWKDLQSAGVGWEFSLESPLPFRRTIESLATASFSERQAQRRVCIAYAAAYLSNSDAANQNRRMFGALLRDAIPKRECAGRVRRVTH